VSGQALHRRVQDQVTWSINCSGVRARRAAPVNTARRRRRSSSAIELAGRVEHGQPDSRAALLEQMSMNGRPAARRRRSPGSALAGEGLVRQVVARVGNDLHGAEVSRSVSAASPLAADQDRERPVVATSFLTFSRVETTASLLDRLAGEAQGAHRQAQPAVVVGRDHLHRDVPGLGRALEQIEQGQAVHVGQADVQHDGVGAKRRARDGTPSLRR
jgi:hypothetical protein